jgi:hypothetical protein
MFKAPAAAAALAMAALSPAVAQTPLQVSQPGDAAMDCAAIAAEAARMDEVVLASNQEIAKADGGARGAGLASTVAVEGMLRTGVLGRMPGAGLFANNAAAAARQHAEAVKAQANERIQAANTRKALLSGLYAGKACDAAPVEPAAPAEPAAPEPVAQVAEP